MTNAVQTTQVTRHVITRPAPARPLGFGPSRAPHYHGHNVPSVAPEKGGQAHAWDEVLVGSHREAGVGVSESFGHDLDWCAGGNEQAGVGMA